MLLIIQFPLSDIRAFFSEETGRLPRPNWLIANPDDDFVRSFGQIRFRRRGGLTGWVGESIICDANKALRFENLQAFINPETGKSYQPKIVFKRFYSDGLAMGKFEVGIEIQLKKTEILSTDLIHKLLRYILQLPVVIPFSVKDKRCQLVDAGKDLGYLYLYSTTKTSFANVIKNSWVKIGKPLIMLLHSSRQIEKIPFLGRHVKLNKEGKVDLRYYLLDYGGKTYPTWVLEEKIFDVNSRAIRIYIARLYAEIECLKKVLESLVKEEIKLTAKSKVSDELQGYLNSSISRINKIETNANLWATDEIDDLARIAIDMIAPGEKEKIIKVLESVNVRLNVLRKTEKFLARSTYSDYYEHVKFSRAYNIADKELRSNIVRALKNITYRNVDLGLFDLGKILENELRLLLEIYISSASIDINKRELTNMNRMIDCLEKTDIPINKNDIHFLRQERNKRAHGQVPSLEERKELMLYAPFLVDLYIKYISLFNEKRKSII